MPTRRLDQVLDAAYTCLLRFGRRATMEDIATAAGLSRSALYQYVTSRDDAFARVRRRMFDRALAEARAVADAADAPLAERIAGLLAVKLDLVREIHERSPHGAELLAEHARLPGGGAEILDVGMRSLLSELLAAGRSGPERALNGAGHPADLADLLLALARGLEPELDQPGRARHLLDQGVRLLVAAQAPDHPRRTT